MTEVKERAELEQRAAPLPVADQLLLVETILAGLRKSQRTGREDTVQHITSQETWYTAWERIL